MINFNIKLQGAGEVKMAATMSPRCYSRSVTRNRPVNMTLNLECFEEPLSEAQIAFRNKQKENFNKVYIKFQNQIIMYYCLKLWYFNFDFDFIIIGERHVRISGQRGWWYFDQTKWAGSWLSIYFVSKQNIS